MTGWPTLRLRSGQGGAGVAGDGSGQPFDRLRAGLGEVLDADSVEAFNTINAKRVDFLIVDQDMRPRHAVEYQGQGHHQGTAAARDAVKKEALRRAGIGYIEVFADDGPEQLRQALAKVAPSASRPVAQQPGLARRAATGRPTGARSAT